MSVVKFENFFELWKDECTKHGTYLSRDKCFMLRHKLGYNCSEIRYFFKTYFDLLVNYADKQGWRIKIPKNLNKEKTNELSPNLDINLNFKNVEVIKKQPKILYFDIETTAFGADFGEMLMFGYCWNDNPEVKIVSMLDFKESFELPPERSDYFVVKELLHLINESQISASHYGSKFDLKFMQTRAIIHGFPIADIKWSKIFDTCITSRKNLKLQNNRLDNVAEALGVEQRKGHLDKKYWRRSHAIGNPYFEDALLRMADYCKQDVVVLYEIAQKLMPLTKHLPSYQTMMNEVEMSCRICGNKELLNLGTDVTKANVYTRFQCEKCGAWQRSAKPTTKIKLEDRTMY